MNRDERIDRRSAGTKRQRTLPYDKSRNSQEDKPRVPTILTISPVCRYIQEVLKLILYKGGKQLDCEGVELYRQSLERLKKDLKDCVVTLVITDKPEDCYSTSRSVFPLWKETILSFQDNYMQEWAEEIEDGIYPESLTVITYFRRNKGKLPDEEIQQFEQEFEDLQKEHNIFHKDCKTEEELMTVVDCEVAEKFLKTMQQKSKIKTLTMGRDQKLAKAKHITKIAMEKM